MKKSILITLGIVFASMAVSSCKKDYTCTCTTTVLGVSATRTYDLPNQTRKDATEACDRYEDDANSGGVGTTNCHL
jgi:hypothetical protein